MYRNIRHEQNVLQSQIMGNIYMYIGKGMQSNTTVSVKVYLMAILDNYMFRPCLV